MINCIILAAGLSHRFKSLKALAPITENLNVLQRVQAMLLQTQVTEIIVVLGHQMDTLKPFLLNHKAIKVVYNNHYNFGQTSSVKAGLKAVSADCQGVLIHPVDYPVIQPQTIDILIDQFVKSSSLLMSPTFQNRNGHPPLFSKKLFNEILNLDNEFGLNTIVHAHQKELLQVAVNDQGILRSFNTIDEFNQIKNDFHDYLNKVAS